jgi:hypothetical protein
MTYTSKVDLLLKINELQEQGDISSAMRLQKVFLDSIQSDKAIGKYSVEIRLDRKSKKIATDAGLALITASTIR